jgi:hypothetical protein
METVASTQYTWVARKAAASSPIAGPMHFHRVLIAHSFHDRSIQARAEQIASDPRLNGVAWHHFVIVDPDAYAAADADREGWERAGQPNRLLFKLNRAVQTLQTRLLTAIDCFEPDLLLIHGGATFWALPWEMQGLLTRIRETYPGLSIAVQGRDRWLNIFRRDVWESDIVQRRRMTANLRRWIDANAISDVEVGPLMEVF